MNLNTLWIVISALLVFVMQGGFAMVESGLTRSKNSINVAVKNLTDLGVSFLVFYAVGFALMFGASLGGISGTSGFFLPFGSTSSPVWDAVFFLFQSMFCSTAATIVSGAVAERMRYNAYIIITVVLAGLIYPLFGHWAWGSLWASAGGGWLEALGFVDFAGSTVVHSVGGWVALAALVIVGPRSGRFEQKDQKIPSSSIPMVVLGVILLWFGWFGFNGGSTLAWNEQVPTILVNTAMGAASGMVATLFLGWRIGGKPDVNLVLNGSLAGLVAITANAHAVSAPAALLIGALGGWIMLGTTALLEKLKIDDAVGAIPVHLGAGAWGTIAVAFFGQDLGTGLSFWPQLGVQVLGVLVAGLWSFGVSLVLFKLVNKILPLRVSTEEERLGLNVAEHGASTEVHDFYQVLEHQAKTGDLMVRAPVEPFTEVGQIALRYNSVLDKLESTTMAKDEFGNILDSLHEGLLVIDSQWIVGDYYSAACESLLGTTNIAKRSLPDLLRSMVGSEKAEQLHQYLDLLFQKRVSYATLERVNPLGQVEVFADAQQGNLNPKFLKFNFVPMVELEQITRVMVVIRDVSEEIGLNREMERTRQASEREMELFYSMIHVEPEVLGEFIVGARNTLDQVNEAFKDERDVAALLTRVAELVHGIKGEAHMLGLDPLAQKIHDFESSIEQMAKMEDRENGQLLHLTVEFSGLQTSVDSMAQLTERLGRFRTTLQTMNVSDRDGGLNNLVQTLVQRLGKEQHKVVRLATNGLNGIDRSSPLYQPVKFILGHVIRNAFAHGFERAPERYSLGKSEWGTLSVNYIVSGGQGVLTIRDDGRGIDVEKIRQRLADAGLVDPLVLEKLETRELLSYLFTPSFSTADEADMTRGRGVGLSAVKTLVKQANGKIGMKTKLGEYTELRIELPLAAHALAKEEAVLGAGT